MQSDGKALPCAGNARLELQPRLDAQLRPQARSDTAKGYLSTSEHPGHRPLYENSPQNPGSFSELIFGKPWKCTKPLVKRPTFLLVSWPCTSMLVGKESLAAWKGLAASAREKKNVWPPISGFLGHLV